MTTPLFQKSSIRFFLKAKQRFPIVRDYVVAGLGVEPSLRDYEPHVQPYTTPHVVKL